jgi:hypothetical protein
MAHIDDLLTSVSSMEPVDGHHADLYSAHGEPQGQTTLTIMSNVILQMLDADKHQFVQVGEQRNAKKVRIQHMQN